MSLLFFSQWCYLLLSFSLCHSHSFLAIIHLSFFDLTGQFSLVFLSTPVLPAWPFSSLIFASLRKLSSFTPSLTPSYSPFLQSFPSLHCRLFSLPCTSLLCRLSLSLPISYPAKHLSPSMDVTTSTGASVIGVMSTDLRLYWKEALCRS